jgi:hypothetical protein
MSDQNPPEPTEPDWLAKSDHPGAEPPREQPPAYGEQPSYGQPPAYGQPPGYGQPPAYGQQPEAQNPYAQNPYAQNPYPQNPYAQNPYGYQGGPVPGSTSALAIVSMILGIVGLIGGFLFVALMPIAAVILGFLGRRRIRQFNQQGSGMALAGIITGFVGIAFFAAYVIVIVIFAASTHTGRGSYGY